MSDLARESRGGDHRSAVAAAGALHDVVNVESEADEMTPLIVVLLIARDDV
jgi:hypothetical protein